LLASAGGLLALVLIASPFAVVVGMLLFGAGFGVTQNASLALMFDRVSPSGYDAASALWSLAYDGGLGLGAAGFGVLLMWTGYPAAFAVTAGLMLTTLGAARSVGRSGTSR
jgi:predicted MFS family arabinose efflux permease